MVAVAKVAAVVDAARVTVADGRAQREVRRAVEGQTHLAEANNPAIKTVEESRGWTGNGPAAFILHPNRHSPVPLQFLLRRVINELFGDGSGSASLN